MNYITTKVDIGIDEPFKLLHISDTHLTLCDERDNERKQELAKSRSKAFYYQEGYLSEAEKYADENDMVIVHTGDLIDFVSEANLDRAKEFTENHDVFFAAGNHEFSLYVGEAFEDKAYRDQSLEHVQESFTNDIRFSSRKINGVNLIAIDDSYYLFDQAQLDALKAEVELGLPIILFLHNPLYEQKLYERAMSNNNCAYLTAVPIMLMREYPADRYRQQKADDITLETVKYIEECPLIKAIFTGHLHYDYEGTVADTIPQYVTGIGSARVIEIN